VSQRFVAITRAAGGAQRFVVGAHERDGLDRAELGGPQLHEPLRVGELDRRAFALDLRGRCHQTPAAGFS
jgi:hypothetical protein